MPRLTLFSTPKPFIDPHIAMIQRNALRSWQALGEQVQVILIGDEDGVAQAARMFGAVHLPHVQRNAMGTPLLSDIFAQAQSVNDSPLLAFVNADIILLADFLDVAELALSQVSQFLLVGQRWDLDVHTDLEIKPGWQEALLAEVADRGRLHPPGGSDYFIFPRGCFETIPEFAIGRAGWDNWMLYAARRDGWSLVDCSQVIKVIHQDHDYSHLPGGQPHYKLPETFENIRLAGGRLVTRITLRDVSHELMAGKITARRITWQRLWRELEIYPMLHGWNGLAKLFAALAHPQRTYREWREYLRQTSAGMEG